MKAAAPRNDLASYPYCVEVTTRFGDMDQLGHINNVAFSRLFEEARVRFNLAIREQQSFADLANDARIVLVANAFQYLHEAHHPDPVMVGIGVSRIGRSSYVMACGMFQHNRLVALNDATLVYAPGGRSVELPADLRGQIQKWMIQESGPT